MKQVLVFAISLIVSIFVSAAEVSAPGLEFSNFETKALSAVLERKFPGAEAEIQFLESKEFPNLSTVKIIVLHEGQIMNAVAPGFSRKSMFDGAVEAIEKVK